MKQRKQYTKEFKQSRPTPRPLPLALEALTGRLTAGEMYEKVAHCV
jgi:hypothetical protein